MENTDNLNLSNLSETVQKLKNLESVLLQLQKEWPNAQPFFEILNKWMGNSSSKLKSSNYEKILNDNREKDTIKRVRIHKNSRPEKVIRIFNEANKGLFADEVKTLYKEIYKNDKDIKNQTDVEINKMIQGVLTYCKTTSKKITQNKKGEKYYLTDNENYKEILNDGLPY